MSEVGGGLSRILRTAGLAGASLILAACAMAGSTPTVELKGSRFEVEIADQPQEQMRGLMFRRELPADHGMLFVYQAAEMQSFWMKNCYIPLDIMYFDDRARLINAHYGVPVCRGDPCPTYPSAAPARYVLELGAGVGRALELKPGDQLKLPP